MECFLEILRCIVCCGGDDEDFPRSNASSSRRNDGYYYHAGDPQATTSCRPYSISTRYTVSAQRQPSIAQPSSRNPPPPLPPKAQSGSSLSPSTDARVRHQLLPSTSPSPSLSASSSTAGFRRLEPPIASKTDAVPSPSRSFSASSSTAALRRLESSIASKTVVILSDVSDVSRKQDSSDSFTKFDFPRPYSKISTASIPPKPPSSPFSPPESGRRIPETPKFKPSRTLSARYEIPEELQELIKRDRVPAVLQNPLSPANYAEYFGTLLYAEDYEIEKWSDYLLDEVTLSLRAKEEFITQKSNSNQHNKEKKHQNDEKFFIAFEVDAVPERRPYLLSRDFVFLRPAGHKNTEPFKGVIFRVIKRNTVLVDFGGDFHRQHSLTKKYDVSFSFNRVCLKRSHVAVSAAADPLLCKILFPDPGATASSPSLVQRYPATVSSSEVTKRILNLKALVPYLIEGPLVDNCTATWNIVREAIIQISRKSFSYKILVCAPRNRTLDALVRGLLDELPKRKLFRANAAFRDKDLVPGDIMSACLFEGECFTCPPPGELLKFDVVTSTFMSSFRLYNAGIKADHFTHIFLLDASSSMEPEAVVSLANLVNEDTRVVVTGSLRDSPRWVRSGIGRRKNGLRRSFFVRLLESYPYCGGDPMYVSHVE